MQQAHTVGLVHIDICFDFSLPSMQQAQQFEKMKDMMEDEIEFHSKQMNIHKV